MNARAMTGSALSAALKKAVDPAISAALQRNGERLRQALDEGAADPSPLPAGGEESGSGSSNPARSLDITLSGENLFAREFGALDATADPVMAPAIERLKRTST